LRRLQEMSASAFKSLLYIEQPTERDLAAHRFRMHDLTEIKPVLADEGIVDLETFNLARELKWSGLALKTCKGHSSALLYVVKATAHGMVYSVQDLTNPGLALVHSAGSSAHINPLKGVEYNARQYLPSSAPEVQQAHRGLFQVRDGTISTETIGSLGLGYQTT
jgi:L-alanine-DL-glutamate epimerase-like enolase superfamily enzyme